MNKIIVAALIGLLMAAGLVALGCEGGGPNCRGDQECTVTVSQNSSGLYIDNDSPKSSCGKATTTETKWSESQEKYVTTTHKGCEVQDIINGGTKKYGTHPCSCYD
jgi:hypothetical protein